ncbi:MAG: pilus assembly protein PilZ [Treponema sp.]|nr:pilus assembly protein PilZ [Treponema sp.]
MGILTAQRVATYYERFKDIDVTFTKDMIQVTGLITEQVHLKCGSDFWPCVFFASSFHGAKIVANTKSGLMEKLQKANNLINLRLSFKNIETASPVTFFVAGRVVGASPYKGSNDISLLSIQFTQRPPDDLIEVIGRVLDANVNSAKRKDDRITITPDSQRKLKLLTKETTAFIQGVPRRCILRDMSFSGAKVIMMGVAKFLVDKETALRFDFDDPRESFLVRGKFIRSENVEGKKEMIALAMTYDEAFVPMGYKIRVNEYYNSLRAADSRNIEEGTPGHTG